MGEIPLSDIIFNKGEVSLPTGSASNANIGRDTTLGLCGSAPFDSDLFPLPQVCHCASLVAARDRLSAKRAAANPLPQVCASLVVVSDRLSAKRAAANPLPQVCASLAAASDRLIAKRAAANGTVAGSTTGTTDVSESPTVTETKTGGVGTAGLTGSPKSTSPGNSGDLTADCNAAATHTDLLPDGLGSVDLDIGFGEKKVPTRSFLFRIRNRSNSSSETQPKSVASERGSVKGSERGSVKGNSGRGSAKAPPGPDGTVAAAAPSNFLSNDDDSSDSNKSKLPFSNVAIMFGPTGLKWGGREGFEEVAKEKISALFNLLRSVKNLQRSAGMEVEEVVHEVGHDVHHTVLHDSESDPPPGQTHQPNFNYAGMGMGGQAQAEGGGYYPQGYDNV